MFVNLFYIHTSIQKYLVLTNIISACRSLPEIDGLSKETVLASWMAKFDCIFKGMLLIC